jgi:hypothetical protein
MRGNDGMRGVGFISTILSHVEKGIQGLQYQHLPGSPLSRLLLG